MSRRGRGEGTITERADGRWQARLTLTLDDGSRVRKSFYGPTRQAVIGKMTLARAELLKGIPVLPEAMTVDQLLELWLEAIRTEVRESTWRGYRVNAWHHISPVVGKVKIARLRAADVEAVKASCSAKGLSPRSTQYVRATLRVAVQWALGRELVSRNVVDLTKGPKVERKPVQPLSAEQVRVFLDGTRGDRLSALYVLAFTLGLRQGELLGLRWSDIDLEAGTLRVIRTYQRRGSFGPPKSDSSRRTLTLPAMAHAALERHREAQEVEIAAMGREWDAGGDLVFPNPYGRPLDAGTLGKWFRGHLERLGLPRQRFHDARHAAASVLLAQHVPLRVVMEVLGHSQISLTANTYSHVMPALHREAAGAMDRALKASGDALSRSPRRPSRLRLIPNPDSQ